MAFITVYFPSNIIAHINVNWLSPVKVRTTLIGGEKKMLVWNDLEPDEKIKVYDKGVDITNGQGVYDLLVSYRSGDMWAPRVEDVEALQLEARYFLDCVASGNDAFQRRARGLARGQDTGSGRRVAPASERDRLRITTSAGCRATRAPAPSRSRCGCIITGATGISANRRRGSGESTARPCGPGRTSFCQRLGQGAQALGPLQAAILSAASGRQRMARTRFLRRCWISRWRPWLVLCVRRTSWDGLNRQAVLGVIVPEIRECDLSRARDRGWRLGSVDGLPNR